MTETSSNEGANKHARTLRLVRSEQGTALEELPDEEDRQGLLNQVSDEADNDRDQYLWGV